MNIDKIDRDWNYRDVLERFEKLVPIAVKISDAAGGIVTINQKILATKIYTRIVLSSITINHILPENAVNANPWWDFPSLATLSRSYLETCHRYFYIVAEGVAEQESNFRQSLYYYHLNSEKFKLYREIDAPSEKLT